MKEAAMYASPNTRQGRSPFWDSRNAYNLFKPNWDGLNLKKTINKRTALFRSKLGSNQCSDLVEGNNMDNNMSPYEVLLVTRKATCLMRAYEVASQHMGLGDEYINNKTF